MDSSPRNHHNSTIRQEASTPIGGIAVLSGPETPRNRRVSGMESSKIILKTSQKELGQNQSLDARVEMRRDAEENMTMASKGGGGNDKIILTEESDDPLCKLPTKYGVRAEPFNDGIEQRRSRGRRASGAYGPVRPEDRNFVTR